MDALGINLGFLIAQIVNFGLIFFALAKWVWPRVLNMLDERQARIAKSLDDARAAEEARANAERERDRLLAEARAEGQRLIDEARQRGDEQRKQMIREAEREAEERRAQARIQAEEERNRILGDARDQIVRLAMAAAERLIATSLDEQSQRATIEKFFTEVPAEAKNLGARVEVTSAVPLTDAEQAQVKRLTGASEVVYHVDPDILGGLILRSGDKVVDGSVRGDLAALSQRLR